MKDTTDSKNENCRYFPQRYVLATLSSVGMAMVFMVRICQRVAISKVLPPKLECEIQQSNVTYLNFCSNKFQENIELPKLDSFFFGYALTHLPGAYLSKQLSAKYTLGFAVLFSDLIFFTSLPLLCRSSREYLMLYRIVLGLAEGFAFPALTHLMSQWAPEDERTLLNCISFAGVQIGVVISMAITNNMVEHYEWSKVYNTIAIVGVIWFILWMFLCYDSPASHPFISLTELNYLKSKMNLTNSNAPTPWKSMLFSKPLGALIIAQMGHDYAIYTIVSQLPAYYQQSCDLNYAKNGDLSGLPFLTIWLTTVLFGYISDRLISLKLYSITSIRRFFATVASVIPGIGMVGATYITDKVSLIAIITISLAFMGGYYSSLRVNALDLSPNHAATIMALSSGSGILPVLTSPAVIESFMLNHCEYPLHLRRFERRKDWQNIFWVMFAVLVLSNNIFLICGSGEVQPWDRDPDQKTPTKVPKEKLSTKAVLSILS